MAIPSATGKEAKYLFVLTLLLVARTQLSIWLADVNGKVVKAIVERDFSKFSYRVSIDFLIVIDLELVHVCSSFFGGELRSRLFLEAAFGRIQRAYY